MSSVRVGRCRSQAFTQVVARGIAAALRDLAPALPDQDLAFTRRLVFEGDDAKLWLCRLYRWPDGSARLVRDVAAYGDRLDDLTARAEEVILLGLVQRARRVVGLATTEPAGRS